MEIGHLVEVIKERRSGLSEMRALLVGISGIDASGKGFVTSKIAEELKAFNVAAINVDGWLNLPATRFDPSNPGENFYNKGLRLDEMFERLVLPIKRDRELDLTMEYAEETATKYRPFTYRLSNVDIILLEGIFIFKKQYIRHFDLKVWIDCPFGTALKRAMSRSQEGLDNEQTIRAYESIYFPAQQIHLRIDKPYQAAEIVFENRS